MPEQDLVLLGYVTKAFGIKGGVVAKFFNGQSDSLFVGQEIFARAKKGQINKLKISSLLDRNRIFFTEICSRDQAQDLVGQEILIDRQDLPKISESEFYLQDLLDSQVIDEENNPIGKVVGFSSNNAQDLLEVDCHDGPKILIPLTKPLVEEIDLENKKIIVNLPENFLDIFDKN